MPILAQRFLLEGLSGHADRAELIEWLRGPSSPDRVFLVHGEPVASEAFRAALRDELGWEAIVAEQGRSVDI